MAFRFGPICKIYVSNITTHYFLDLANIKTGSEEKNVTLSRKEVIKRLRERTEPILLFGENEADAFTRLRRCEILEPEINKVT